MPALGAGGPSSILGAPTKYLTETCYVSAAPKERRGRRAEFDSRRPDHFRKSTLLRVLLRFYSSEVHIHADLAFQ